MLSDQKSKAICRNFGAFVDVGILPQVDNVNSQIIYGCRGTGKTHVMKVLASSLSGREATAVIYMDARTLGSTNQFSDSGVPLPARCTALFRDILNEIHNGLEFVVNVAPAGSESALVDLDVLAAAGTEKKIVPTAVSDKHVSKDTTRSGVALNVNLKAPEAKIESGRDAAAESERITSYVAQESSRIIFPSVSSPMRQILEKCNGQLDVLIDEWSSIPMDVQPYLAEFLRRSLLPLENVTIKIASLEYRSDFKHR